MLIKKALNYNTIIKSIIRLCKYLKLLKDAEDPVTDWTQVGEDDELIIPMEAKTIYIVLERVCIKNKNNQTDPKNYTYYSQSNVEKYTSAIKNLYKTKEVITVCSV